MASPSHNEFTFSEMHVHCLEGRTHYCVILAKVPVGVEEIWTAGNLNQVTDLLH